jgi:outer membrane lipoprotein-sorting protein
METNHTRLILWALSLLFCSCSGIPRPADYSDSADRLMKSIQTRGDAFQSLSAELDVEIWQKDERIRLKQLMAVSQNGRLRIEVLSPFGNPMTTLASDGSRLMIFDAQKGRFFLGAATAEALGQLLPVSMSPQELSSLLRGSIPIIVHESSRVSWLESRGRYELELTAKGRSQKVELEPQYLRVTKLTTWINGQLLYRVFLGNYSGTGNGIVPLKVRFEVPARELSVELDVVEFSVNPALPDTAFTLTPPRGILVEPL